MGGLTVLSVAYQTYQQLFFLGVNISEQPIHLITTSLSLWLISSMEKVCYRYTDPHIPVFASPNSVQSLPFSN
jgi:hypothetical protein